MAGNAPNSPWRICTRQYSRDNGPPPATDPNSSPGRARHAAPSRAHPARPTPSDFRIHCFRASTRHVASVPKQRGNDTVGTLQGLHQQTACQQSHAMSGWLFRVGQTFTQPLPTSIRWHPRCSPTPASPGLFRCCCVQGRTYLRIKHQQVFHTLPFGGKGLWPVHPVHGPIQGLMGFPEAWRHQIGIVGIGPR